MLLPLFLFLRAHEIIYYYEKKKLSAIFFKSEQNKFDIDTLVVRTNFLSYYYNCSFSFATYFIMSHSKFKLSCFVEVLEDLVEVSERTTFIR